MFIVKFIGDLHFNHEYCSKLRGFNSINTHNEYIIESWNKNVTKKDKIFILGDISLNANDYPLLDNLNGRKIVIMGNHDPYNKSRELLRYVEYIGGAVKYKGFFITHIPIHPIELTYRKVRGNIHAHTHKNTLGHPYVCVSAEVINYIPISFNEILNKFKAIQY